MTWRIIGSERNMPPCDFQERLTSLGGVNKYDEPLYKIWWSSYGHEDGSFIAGGAWSVDEAYFVGYRRLLKGNGEQCWCLGEWHDAIEYSSPESYYLQHRDESTGLCTLGPYPYSGRYELLYSLRWYERVENRLEFHTMPLSSWVFEMVIPIIVKAKELSFEKRKQAMIEARRKEEEEKLLQVERHLRAKAIPFYDTVSYTRQGIRSSLIDQKAIALQKAWNQMSDAARSLRPGLQIR